MSDTGNTVQATPGPIPPPVWVFPFVDLRTGKLTNDGIIVLQQMWAALQGAGGIIDLINLALPSAGITLAQAQAIVDAAAGGALELAYPAGALAALQQQVNEALDTARAALTKPPAAAAPGAGAQVSIITTETLTAGMAVNVFSSAGAFRVRKADTTSAIAAPKDMHGFVLQGFAIGQAARVRMSGFINLGLAGLTPGPAFLGAAGAITSVPNVTAGQISQQVGIAVGAGNCWFQPMPVIGL